MTSHADNEKLTDAMFQIENLQKQFSEEKSISEKKVYIILSKLYNYYNNN